MHRRHFLKTTATGALAPFAASALIRTNGLAQANGEPDPKLKAIRDRIAHYSSSRIVNAYDSH